MTSDMSKGKKRPSHQFFTLKKINWIYQIWPKNLYSYSSSIQSKFNFSHRIKYIYAFKELINQLIYNRPTAPRLFMR